MKIGFVSTTHYSEKLRPNGRCLISEYIDSLYKSCLYDYTIYIMDNGSTEEIDPNLIKNKIKYTYIKDQYLQGITGAWNLGIKKAINDGCDIIINTNDDITFNETINDFIEIVSEHDYRSESIYGPVTNIGGCPGPNNQERDKAGNRILEATQTSSSSCNKMHGINGFFNAFTKECFYNFEENDALYSTEKQYMIHGQESEMQIRLGKRGLKSFIVESCMVEHAKTRGWLQLKELICQH